MGTGVGVNAVLSRSLGEKDFRTADESAKNGIFLAFISCVVFAVLGVALAKPDVYKRQVKALQHG